MRLLLTKRSTDLILSGSWKKFLFSKYSLHFVAGQSVRGSIAYTKKETSLFFCCSLLRKKLVLTKNNKIYVPFYFLKNYNSNFHLFYIKYIDYFFLLKSTINIFFYKLLYYRRWKRKSIKKKQSVASNSIKIRCGSLFLNYLLIYFFLRT